MEAIWNTIYGAGIIFGGFLSWAIFLGLSAKFVFEADARYIVSCFFIGLGINATVLVFGVFRLHPMTTLYTEKEWELHWVTTGLLSIPVAIAAFGGLYLALRRLLLAEAEEPPESGDCTDPDSTSARSASTERDV